MVASVVLVHGLRTSATMWRAQLSALQTAGIPATAVDLPGHGRRLAQRFRLDDALQCIEDAVLTLPRPRLLVGLSLGGYLALHYAGGVGRDRMDGVLAAACGTVPGTANLGVYAGVAAAIRRLPDRGAAVNQHMINLMVPPGGRADVVAGGVALDVMADALGELRALRPIAEIRRVRVPLLFVNGQFDHFRSNERRYLAAARSRTGCGSAGLIVVPGASHLVSLTRPDLFTRILLHTVSAVGPAGARGEEPEESPAVAHPTAG